MGRELNQLYRLGGYRSKRGLEQKGIALKQVTGNSDSACDLHSAENLYGRPTRDMSEVCLQSRQVPRSKESNVNLLCLKQRPKREEIETRQKRLQPGAGCRAPTRQPCPMGFGHCAAMRTCSHVPWQANSLVVGWCRSYSTLQLQTCKQNNNTQRLKTQREDSRSICESVPPQPPA